MKKAGFLEQQAFWPPGHPAGRSIWALLDLARDPRVLAALLDSRLEYRCLYSGRLPRALELAAPHMVEILPGHRLLPRLLDEGFGCGWGVFLATDDPDNLRHHLRKHLMVRDEAGRKLLFRFYDPRVLRAFLPVAEPAQLTEFFGPVSEWFAEDGQGGVLRFSRGRDGQLERTQLLTATAPV
jgi:Domain of unknown function (DUF4123)